MLYSSNWQTELSHCLTAYQFSCTLQSELLSVIQFIFTGFHNTVINYASYPVMLDKVTTCKFFIGPQNMDGNYCIWENKCCLSKDCFYGEHTFIILYELRLKKMSVIEKLYISVILDSVSYTLKVTDLQIHVFCKEKWMVTNVSSFLQTREPWSSCIIPLRIQPVTVDNSATRLQSYLPLQVVFSVA